MEGLEEEGGMGMSSEGALRGGDAATLSSAEHKRLVDLSEASGLGFEFSDLLDHLGRAELEVADVGGSPIQQRHLGRLLVGSREDLLELAVPISEFIATPLFGLDTLSTDLFTTLGDDDFAGRQNTVQAIIVVLIIIVIIVLALGGGGSPALLPLSVDDACDTVALGAVGADAET